MFSMDNHNQEIHIQWAMVNAPLRSKIVVSLNLLSVEVELICRWNHHNRFYHEIGMIGTFEAFLGILGGPPNYKAKQNIPSSSRKNIHNQ